MSGMTATEAIELLLEMCSKKVVVGLEELLENETISMIVNENSFCFRNLRLGGDYI
jgi:hypothetical protein